MYTRMIARDVARNRSVAVVLIVLMTLPVALATAGAGTLVRLTGASARLMDRAEAPHVVQLHAGDYDQDQVDRWVAARPEIADHRTMLMLGIDGADLFFDEAPQTTNIQQIALVVPHRAHDLLLLLDDRPITAVDPGTIVLPVLHQIEDGLEVGDPVGSTGPDGFAEEFTVAGFSRDSIMNPAITSSKRLAVSGADLEEVRAHTGTVEHMLEFWLHDPDARTAAFEQADPDSDTPKAGQMVDSATFRMLTMIGDGMVAAVVGSHQDITRGGRTAKVMLLTRDVGPIAVQWALGADDAGLRRHYLTRILVVLVLVLVLGVVAGTIVANSLREQLFSLMFEVMFGGSESLGQGTSRIDFAVHPLPAYLARLAPRDELNDRAMHLMERTGVADLADRDVSAASGGQLQRVGICRALINHPTVLFGDEPTGALDSTAATDIMDILGELNAEGTTVVLVTHDAKVAARTDRVLYMVDGRIVGDRQQGRYAGTDLDQRHAGLARWLLQRGF